MRHVKRRGSFARHLSAVMVLGLVLTACGGGDDGDEAAPDETDATAGEAAGDENEPDPDSQASETEPADDGEVASFYEGETFNIIVGFSAGGGYDTYARTIAPHIGDHIPGQPDVIVENMTGAGSLVAANQLASALPSDGTHMGHFIGGLLLGQVLGNPAAQFEAREFNYIGAAVADTTTCVVRTDAGVDTLADLRDREEPLVFGGVGTGSNTDDVPNTLKEFFDLNLELVSGYGGTADIRVAMEQGEVDAGCWAWESQRVILEEELESGALKPIAQAGDEPHPDNPDVPLFQDLAENEQEQQIISAAIDAPALFARPFVMHPDVPQERVQASRQAFADTMQDEAFLERAEGSNLAIDPVSGERLQELVESLYELPDDLKADLAQVFVPDQG